MNQIKPEHKARKKISFFNLTSGLSIEFSTLYEQKLNNSSHWKVSQRYRTSSFCPVQIPIPITIGTIGTGSESYGIKIEVLTAPEIYLAAEKQVQDDIPRTRTPSFFRVIQYIGFENQSGYDLQKNNNA